MGEGIHGVPVKSGPAGLVPCSSAWHGAVVGKLLLDTLRDASLYCAMMRHTAVGVADCKCKRVGVLRCLIGSCGNGAGCICANPTSGTTRPTAVSDGRVLRRATRCDRDDTRARCLPFVQIRAVKSRRAEKAAQAHRPRPRYPLRGNTPAAGLPGYRNRKGHGRNAGIWPISMIDMCAISVYYDRNGPCRVYSREVGAVCSRA